MVMKLMGGLPGGLVSDPGALLGTEAGGRSVGFKGFFLGGSEGVFLYPAMAVLWIPLRG